MQVTIDRVISRSKEGRRMQVTVLHGEGSEQRSETRHVVRDNGIWIGNNPDPTAVSRDENARKVLESAKSAVERLAAKIADCEEALAGELTEAELNELKAKNQADGKRIVGKILSGLRVKLGEAKTTLTVAEKQKEEVAEAYPLTVQFIGLG